MPGPQGTVRAAASSAPDDSDSDCLMGGPRFSARPAKVLRATPSACDSEMSDIPAAQAPQDSAQDFKELRAIATSTPSPDSKRRHARLRGKQSPVAVSRRGRSTSPEIRNPQDSDGGRASSWNRGMLGQGKESAMRGRPRRASQDVDYSPPRSQSHEVDFSPPRRPRWDASTHRPPAEPARMRCSSRGSREPESSDHPSVSGSKRRGRSVVQERPPASGSSRKRSQLPRSSSAPPPPKICSICHDEIEPHEKCYKWYVQHLECGLAAKASQRRLERDEDCNSIIITITATVIQSYSHTVIQSSSHTVHSNYLNSSQVMRSYSHTVIQSYRHTHKLPKHIYKLPKHTCH